jgi:hypothetical protein
MSCDFLRQRRLLIGADALTSNNPALNAARTLQGSGREEDSCGPCRALM